MDRQWVDKKVGKWADPMDIQLVRWKAAMKAKRRAEQKVVRMALRWVGQKDTMKAG